MPETRRTRPAEPAKAKAAYILAIALMSVVIYGGAFAAIDLAVLAMVRNGTLDGSALVDRRAVLQLGAFIAACSVFFGLGDAYFLDKVPAQAFRRVLFGLIFFIIGCLSMMR